MRIKESLRNNNVKGTVLTINFTSPKRILTPNAARESEEALLNRALIMKNGSSVKTPNEIIGMNMFDKLLLNTVNLPKGYKTVEIKNYSLQVTVNLENNRILKLHYDDYKDNKSIQDLEIVNCNTGEQEATISLAKTKHPSIMQTKKIQYIDSETNSTVELLLYNSFEKIVEERWFHEGNPYYQSPYYRRYSYFHDGREFRVEYIKSLNIINTKFFINGEVVLEDMWILLKENCEMLESKKHTVNKKKIIKKS